MEDVAAKTIEAVTENIVAYEPETASYTIRVAGDCSPERFIPVAGFVEFEDASEYIRRMHWCGVAVTPKAVKKAAGE